MLSPTRSDLQKLAEFVVANSTYLRKPEWRTSNGEARRGDDGVHRVVLCRVCRTWTTRRWCMLMPRTDVKLSRKSSSFSNKFTNRSTILALSYTSSPRVLTVGCHALTSSITARLIYLFIALVPSRTLNAQHHLIHYLTAAVNVYLTHTHRAEFSNGHAEQ